VCGCDMFSVVIYVVKYKECCIVSRTSAMVY